MMLSAQKIADFKKRLEEERNKLAAQMEESTKSEDFGSDVDDNEEGDEAEEFANNVAIGQALKDRVNEIDGALNRIEMGTYGLCEKCNRPISEEMLGVVPETKLCADCKQAA